MEPILRKTRERQLAEIPTADLAAELARRRGVEEHAVDALMGKAELYVDNDSEGYCADIDGPARIFVVTD